LKAQAGDKRWFKGTKKFVEGVANSFSVVGWINKFTRSSLEHCCSVHKIIQQLFRCVVFMIVQFVTNKNNSVGTVCCQT
jgi:hypothetical protein